MAIEAAPLPALITELESLVPALVAAETLILYIPDREEQTSGLIAYVNTLESLVKLGKTALKPHMQGLFEVLLDLWNSEVSELAKSAMSALAEAVEMESLQDLFALELPLLLPSLIQDYEHWGVRSKARLAFQTLVIGAETAVVDYFSPIIDVISVNTQLGKDSAVRSAMLEVLSALLAAPSLRPALRPFSQRLFREVLCPVLHWKPGAAGSQVRLAGIKCVLALLTEAIPEPAVLVSDWTYIFPVLQTCLEDDYDPNLRLFACETLGELVSLCRYEVREAEVTEVCAALRRRLDDSKDFVRLAACEALKKGLGLGKKVDCLGEVVRGLMLELEETNVSIVNASKEALIYAQALDPSLPRLSPV